MNKWLNILFTGRSLYVYYAILLVTMMSWTDINSSPPLLFRLTFLTLVCFPACIDRNSIMPAALICFWGTTINGYSFSYMPYPAYTYVAVLIVLLPFMWRSSKPIVTYSGMFLIPGMALFLLLRDLIGDLEIQFNAISLLIISLLPIYMNKWDSKAIEKMEIAFMVMSLILSYYSFTTRSLFYGDFGSFAGEKRSIWADPNYLSAVMGMGALIGIKQVISIRKTNLSNRILGVFTFAVTFIAMLALASRGGMLCLLISTIILLLFSKVNPVLKATIIICAVIFLVILYTNSFFDMLEERINSDDGTGSERTIIWSRRLSAFANSNNPLKILFGYSFHGGLKLGMPYEFGSHNDFVAFLAEYGIVGLCMFIAFLLIPIINLHNLKEVKVEVFAGVIYLGLACCTIEPFASGRSTYYLFWFYLTMLSVMTNNNHIKKQALEELITRFRQTETYKSKVSKAGLNGQDRK